MLFHLLTIVLAISWQKQARSRNANIYKMAMQVTFILVKLVKVIPVKIETMHKIQFKSFPWIKDHDAWYADNSIKQRTVYQFKRSSVGLSTLSHSPHACAYKMLLTTFFLRTLTSFFTSCIFMICKNVISLRLSNLTRKSKNKKYLDLDKWWCF